jgi:hypothetical protein
VDWFLRADYCLLVSKSRFAGLWGTESLLQVQNLSPALPARMIVRVHF